MTLPDRFVLVDVDLENPTDDGWLVELQYWKKHPEQGYALSWPVLGTLIPPKDMLKKKREEYIVNGSWAAQDGKITPTVNCTAEAPCDPDHLHARLAATRAILLNESAPAPVVMSSSEIRTRNLPDPREQPARQESTSSHLAGTPIARRAATARASSSARTP